MDVPGSATVNRVISKDCRRRPADDFIQEVGVEVIRELYELHQNWPADSDVRFHVVVTVERPGK